MNPIWNVEAKYRAWYVLAPTIQACFGMVDLLAKNEGEVIRLIELLDDGKAMTIWVDGKPTSMGQIAAIEQFAEDTGQTIEDAVGVIAG